MGDFSTITPKAGNDSLGSWRYCWQLVGGKKKKKRKKQHYKNLQNTAQHTNGKLDYLPDGVPPLWRCLM